MEEVTLEQALAKWIESWDNDCVLSWFTLSLIVAALAQGRNRSGFGWWLFAILTGPFALFWLVVFADKIQNPCNCECNKKDSGD